jgi:hypothetical protein
LPAPRFRTDPASQSYRRRTKARPREPHPRYIDLIKHVQYLFDYDDQAVIGALFRVVNRYVVISSRCRACFSTIRRREVGALSASSATAEQLSVALLGDHFARARWLSNARRAWSSTRSGSRCRTIRATSWHSALGVWQIADGDSYLGFSALTRST